MKRKLTLLWTSLLTLFRTIITPFVLLLRSGFQILNAALTTLFAVPAGILDVISSRLQTKVKNLSGSMDSRSQRRREQQEKQQEEKALNTALEILFYAGDFIHHVRISRRVKHFLILGLQAVSFLTTYRGLTQCFAELHFAVPLIFAVVIQVGLTFLAATISYHHAPGSQKFLLVMFLMASMVFSYLGVSESMQPYSEYVQGSYTDFKNSYDQVLARLRENERGGDNPVASLEGQYSKIEQLLREAEAYYGDGVLTEAEQRLAEYREMTVSEIGTKETTTTVYSDGTSVTKGGASILMEKEDPEAKLYIKQEEENIREIRQKRALMEEIRVQLKNSCNLQKAIRILTLQMETEEELPEFRKLCTEIETLFSQCEKLAADIDFSQSFSADLEDLLVHYRYTQLAASVEECPDFRELYRAWKEEETRLEITENELLNDVLTALTAHVPTRLRELADDTVFDRYSSLVSVASALGAKEEGARLEEAFQAYQLVHPVTYMLQRLSPKSDMFSTALTCGVIAICNDLLAVLIGLWMEHRQINWVANRTLTRANLVPHLYSQFKAAFSPIILHRLEDNNRGLEEICKVYMDILQDFLHMFQVSARLYPEGYIRFAPAVFEDNDMELLCTFLLTWGFVKIITSEQAQALGIVGKDRQEAATDYLLLSIRGEGWLVEMLGSAADMKLDHPQLAY